MVNLTKLNTRLYIRLLGKLANYNIIIAFSNMNFIKNIIIVISIIIKKFH